MNKSIDEIEISIIKHAKILGHLGLIPFAFSSLLVWLPKYNELAQASLTIYAAVILTFIGAVNWGIVISTKSVKNSTAKLIFSIIPALISWILLLTSTIHELLMFAICFLILWWVEQLMMKDLMPNWYIKLRNRLSFFVVILLLFGWIGLLQ